MPAVRKVAAVKPCHFPTTVGGYGTPLPYPNLAYDLRMIRLIRPIPNRLFSPDATDSSIQDEMIPKPTTTNVMNQSSIARVQFTDRDQVYSDVKLLITRRLTNWCGQCETLRHLLSCLVF